MRRFIITLALLGIAWAAQAENYLFDKGKTDWKIYLPESSGITEKFAAEELKKMLKKVADTDFEIITGGVLPSGRAIVIGPSGKAGFDELDSFSIETIDGNLHLKGNCPRATLYAVYSFLENELGMRWYWAGDDGEYYTPRASWSLPELKRRETSAFLHRMIVPISNHRYEDMGYWLARHKVNIYSKRAEIQNLTGMVRTPIAISSHQIYVPESMFKDHPDWFSMINGKRIQKGNGGCWSNPEFTRYVAGKITKLAKDSNAELINVFPADITTRCQCPECARNPDPSSRWYDYYHKLQQEIKKTLPNLRFAGIAYMEYRAVPVSEIKDLEYVQYCQSDRCYVHKLDDPTCKLNQKSLKELDRWSKKTKIGIYGYQFDVFDCPMMLPFWNVLADEIRQYHKRGDVLSMKTEFPCGYPQKHKPEDMYHITARLAGYIYAKLVWNPAMSVDDIINEWCEHVFGPAAPEMADYYRQMAMAWENSGAHLTYYTHPPQGFAKKFVSKKLIDAAEADFKIAREKLKDHPRELRQLEIEAAIFNKWKCAAETANPAINVIKTDSADQVPFRQMIDKKGKITDTKVRIYRNDSALMLRIECDDIPGLDGGKPGCDEFWSAGKNDKLEIFLELNDGTAYRHFALNRNGGYFEAMGLDQSWKMDWKRKITKTQDGWIAEIELPFSGLEAVPTADSRWYITVNRYSDPYSGYPAPNFHNPSSGAVLLFNEDARSDRNLVWISTSASNISSFFPALLKDGWNYQFFDKPAEVTGYDISGARMIILTVNKWDDMPERLFSDKIIPAVRGGAVLLMELNGSPLDKYFKDKTFKIRFGEKGIVTPRNGIFAPAVSGKLRQAFPVPPPAYFTPAVPEEWNVLGKIELKDGTEQPFLISRRYGKGVVFVTKFNGGWPRTAKYVVPMITELYENAEKLSVRP